jgi:hypothetical protein
MNRHLGEVKVDLDGSGSRNEWFCAGVESTSEQRGRGIAARQSAPTLSISIEHEDRVLRSRRFLRNGRCARASAPT